jgi:hypothetical protein
MGRSSRLSKGFTMAAFGVSAIGTVLLLLLLASVGPFDEHAPPLLWSVVLWAMVGLAAFVVVLRLVMLAFVALAGLVYAGRRGAVVVAQALRTMFIGL